MTQRRTFHRVWSGRLSLPKPAHRADEIEVLVNGNVVRVPNGALVSTALLNVGAPCRTSVSGEPRTALCGMGICFECRAMVNGVLHRRTCQLPCAAGMQIESMS